MRRDGARGVAAGVSGRRSLRGEAELGHPLGVPLGEPGEHPADRGQVEPGRSTPPASSADSASRSAATRCAWVSASPISRRPHSASRPPSRGSAAIAARTRSTTNSRVPGVLERGDDQVAGVGVEVRRDLAVEVGGQPVADVGLDQALEPVRRARCARGRGRSASRNGAIAANGSAPSSVEPVAAAARRGRTRRLAIAAIATLSSQRRAPAWRPRRAARRPRSRRTRSRRAGRRRPRGRPGPRRRRGHLGRRLAPGDSVMRAPYR